MGLRPNSVKFRCAVARLIELGQVEWKERRADYDRSTDLWLTIGKENAGLKIGGRFEAFRTILDRDAARGTLLELALDCAYNHQPGSVLSVETPWSMQRRREYSEYWGTDG